MTATCPTCSGQTTETSVEWAIAYDDGDTSGGSASREECEEILAEIEQLIHDGSVDEADYEGRRIVRRVVTTHYGPWEPA